MFQATITEHWQEHLRLETKVRLEQRSIFSARADEAQSTTRVRRRAMHEKRNALAQEREKRAVMLQNSDRDRHDARAREQHYQNHFIRREYRGLLTALRRQGLLLYPDELSVSFVASLLLLLLFGLFCLPCASLTPHMAGCGSNVVCFLLCVTFQWIDGGSIPPRFVTFALSLPCMRS